MRRGVLVQSILVTALAVAPAATADKPIREVIPAPDERIIDDLSPSWCSDMDLCPRHSS
jgi:hypothetical protein